MKNERTLSGRTKLLYEQDSYIHTFEATVIDCKAFSSFARSKEINITDKDNSLLYAIELNQTAFFPEGGGQCSDTGYLNESPVYDVFKEDGRVYHVTDCSYELDETVSCRLDFEKRYSNMQNHSGEHLVCGLINKLYGFDNVGFHLSGDLITVDVNGVLTAEDFDRIELLANQAIYENRSITSVYPEESDYFEYRSKIDLEEEIRVVVIEGYDACACCAPHVKSTGEIGIIKIIDFMNHRGGMRFSLKCGRLAYLELKQIYNQNKEIMGMLSSKRSECAEAVARQCVQAKESHEREIQLKKEIVNLYLKTLKDENIFFSSTLDDVQVRTIVNETVKTTSGIVAGFIEQSDNSYRYIISKSEDCDIDLKQFAKDMNLALNGRGGGSDKMIQGSVVASNKEIKAFLSK